MAFLVSAREGKHADALRLLEQAKRFGPNPDLIDTEALVRLNNNEAEAARKLLESVVAEAPTGPAYFHLAQAELATERKIDARIAWKRAMELGLRRADLHPLEWSGFDQMTEKMK